MDELKPCPFCGGKAEMRLRGEEINGQLFPLAIVECVQNCGSNTWQGDEMSAIAAWNTRVFPEREALEKIRGLAMDSGNVLGARMAEIITIATAALGGSDETT